jgi:hypothetical protein
MVLNSLALHWCYQNASNHKEKKKQTAILISDICYFNEGHELDVKMCNYFSKDRYKILLE